MHNRTIILAKDILRKNRKITKAFLLLFLISFCCTTLCAMLHLKEFYIWGRLLTLAIPVLATICLIHSIDYNFYTLYFIPRGVTRQECCHAGMLIVLLSFLCYIIGAITFFATDLFALHLPFTQALYSLSFWIADFLLFFNAFFYIAFLGFKFMSFLFAFLPTFSGAFFSKGYAFILTINIDKLSFDSSCLALGGILYPIVVLSITLLLLFLNEFILSNN